MRRLHVAQGITGLGTVGLAALLTNYVNVIVGLLVFAIGMTAAGVLRWRAMAARGWGPSRSHEHRRNG